MSTAPIPTRPLRVSEVAEVASWDERPVGWHQSSWAPAAISEVLADGFTPIEPTVLQRADGLHLFYAGLTHDLHGESESGKSWLAQCSVAEVLRSGGTALYCDFESDARAVVLRLKDLQVPMDILMDRSRFVYLHPDSPPHGAFEKPDFEWLFTRAWTVAVIDGVTNAMTVLGLDGLNLHDVSKYHSMLAERLAVRTGAAVIQVDHVPKNSESRRGSIGSVHKLNAITGASYLVSIKKPLARGSVGLIEVRVGKDRPGAIRARSGPVRKGDQTQQTALVEADASTGVIRFTFAPPELRSDDSEWRPTALMETISRHLEGSDQAQSQRAVRAAVTGKTETKALALEHLVKDGFVSETDGPRGATLYASVTPFRVTSG